MARRWQPVFSFRTIACHNGRRSNNMSRAMWAGRAEDNGAGQLESGHTGQWNWNRLELQLMWFEQLNGRRSRWPDSLQRTTHRTFREHGSNGQGERRAVIEIRAPSCCFLSLFFFFAFFLLFFIYYYYYLFSFSLLSTGRIIMEASRIRLALRMPCPLLSRNGPAPARPQLLWPILISFLLLCP